jgi:hypothetical protein
MMSKNFFYWFKKYFFLFETVNSPLKCSLHFRINNLAAILKLIFVSKKRKKKKIKSVKKIKISGISYKKKCFLKK